MTTLPNAYTNLESLLLFQALRAEPVNPTTFSKISDQLQAIPIVRNDPNYEPGRLSPDALRELYLRLLKDEVKRDLDQQNEKDKHVTNGDLSPGSRKRKAPSPSLPTVNEAAQHAHLIPHLITRLYARYREESINVIREHERRFDSIKRDLVEIEAGKWDERIQKMGAATPTANQSALKNAAKQGDAKSATGSPKPFDKSAQTNGARSNTPLATSQTAPNNSQPSSRGHQTPSSGNQSPYVPNHGQPIASQTANPQAQNAFSKASASPRPNLLPNQPPMQPMGTPNARGPPLQPHPHQGLTPQGNFYQQQGQMIPGQPGQPVIYPAPPGQVGGPQGQQFWQGGQQPGQPLRRPDLAQQQQTPRSQQTLDFPPRQAGASQQPPTGSATGPRPPPVSRMVSDIVAALATPVRQDRKPLWKSDSGPRPISIPNLPPRPAVEPLSPTFKRAKSPVRPTRAGRSRASPPQEDKETDAAAQPRKGRKRGARDRSPQSVASSAADEGNTRKMRSQSVSTAAGRPVSRGNVKDEPSTPGDMMEDAPRRSATPASGPRTRTRRGTAQPPSSARRRQSTQVGDEDIEMATTPPPPPKTVTALRNLAKMSSTIMNDINSHKHASYFAGPVRDRDASGYSDIIKQPQHLKSVRAAITAGTRASTSAAATIESEEEPFEGVGRAIDANTLELDRTTDLIPPKAIVNGAQLEKEVMRMFANAVMFNPGEDGLVSDTREMYEDVEPKIRSWRGVDAEREAGEEEEDVKGKRRKM